MQLQCGQGSLGVQHPEPVFTSLCGVNEYVLLLAEGKQPQGAVTLGITGGYHRHIKYIVAHGIQRENCEIWGIVKK